MTIHLTRAQQRRMQKLADQVDKVSQADRRFFERFPHRQHRVRLASHAEIEQHRIIDGGQRFAPDGYAVFTIVRNIATGVRMRLFLVAPDTCETDVSENTAHAIFVTAATPRSWEIEGQLRKAAEARA
jgi:hypothetical protein